MTELKHLLWAKSNPYMSLETHMMCVGICGQIYLTAPSSVHVLRFLADKWHCTEQQTINRVGYLFAMHDIGKCHPAFQMKDDTCLQRWKDAGYGEWFSKRDVCEGFRHEYWSERYVKDSWLQYGWDELAADVFSAVLRIHHQKSVENGKIRKPCKEGWIALCDELEQKMRLFFTPDQFTLPDNTDAVCLLLSALLIVCDWVASSDLVGNVESMTEAEIRESLRSLLYRCDIVSDELFPKYESFADMFPEIKTPRPLQLVCDKLDPAARLTIIEAPMGEGKTETALYIANRLCQSTGSRGIYVALPTQATSNQMYARVNAVLSGSEKEAARLLHGLAFLNETPQAFDTEDEESAAKWMRPSRMGLLQANAVGTVDQVMAGVLLSKFSIIRMAGLAGKVLVIDEIHAYDMYMSQIIEILLRWCAAMDIPVILLSATLQNAQKARYLSAFDIDASSAECNAYPLITQVTPDGIVVYHEAEAEQTYHYRLKPIPAGDDINEIISIAEEKIAHDGCIAIIVNTVKRAQQLYEQLLHNVGKDTVTMLFHARFPVGRKAEIEKKCVDLFGKNRTNRPKKGILVATQVVEQSIDLDFDAMISDLAPVDLLLQRAGRLHRHRQYTRPAGLEEPVVHVVVPDSNATDELAKRYGVSGKIYAPFLLYNTEKWLADGVNVIVPQDIRPTIEKVYTDVTQENTDAYLKEQMKGLLESSQAKGCTLSFPMRDLFFPAERPVYFDLREQDDGFDSTKEASTRLADETVRVAFAEESLFTKAQTEGLNASEAMTVFMQSVSIRYTPDVSATSDNIFRVDKGLLRGTFVVNGTSGNTVGEKELVNDPILGVSWKE